MCSYGGREGVMFLYLFCMCVALHLYWSRFWGESSYAERAGAEGGRAGVMFVLIDPCVYLSILTMPSLSSAAYACLQKRQFESQKRQI